MKLSSREIVLAGLFAAVISILAQFTIPFGPIPLTLQTFAVGFVVTILGKKTGTIADKMPVKRKRALRLFSKFPIDRRRLFAKRFRSPRRREATYRCPLGRKSRHYPKVSIYSERKPRKNALESNLAPARTESSWS